MKLRNCTADVLERVNHKIAGPALGCLVIGVVLWPLFPVGVVLGVTVSVLDTAASRLRTPGSRR